MLWCKAGKPFGYMFLFLALLAVKGCNKKNEDATPTSIATVNLNVIVKTVSGELVSGARVVINNPVVERVDRNGKSYTKYTRVQSDAQGVATFAGLPTKNSDDEVIDYEVFVWHSGYQMGSQKITVETNQNIEVPVTLQAESNTTDAKIALIDYEAIGRGAHFLTGQKLLFQDITENLSTVDLSVFKSIVVGLDNNKVVRFVDEFVQNKTKILDFVQNGGVLYFCQQNDAGWISDLLPVPIVMVDEALRNDFTTAEVADATHALMSGITNADLKNWSYNQFTSSTVVEEVFFDCMEKNTGWKGIMVAPSAERQSGSDPEKDAAGNIVAAQKYWVAAELTHGNGKIIMNQSAYYQGTYGTQTTPGAIKIANNVTQYLISLSK